MPKQTVHSQDDGMKAAARSMDVKKSEQVPKDTNSKMDDLDRPEAMPGEDKASEGPN